MGSDVYGIATRIHNAFVEIAINNVVTNCCDFHLNASHHIRSLLVLDLAVITANVEQMVTNFLEILAHARE